MIIGRGKSSEIFLQEDGTILKLFFIGKEHRFVSERHNHLAIEDQGLPIAGFLKSVEVEGRKGIVYSGLGYGKSLAAHLKKGPFNFRSIAKEMANLQRQIHATKISGLEDYQVILEDEIKRSSVFNKKVIPVIREFMNCFPKQSNVLCHGDFHWENIIKYRENCFVIDWGKAHRGPFPIDLARTQLFFVLPNMQETAVTRIIKRTLIHIFKRSYMKFYFSQSTPISANDWRSAQIIACIELLNNRGVPGKKVTKNILVNNLNFDIVPFVEN